MYHLTRIVARCVTAFCSSINIVCILSVLTILFSVLSGQKNVVSLSHTFDLDQDGLSEFLALEKKNFIDAAPSSAVFYEIDDYGSHIELWRHTTMHHILAAEIGDIDGDAVPEIVVLSRSYTLRSNADDLPWLKVFRWTGIDFSPSPTISIGGLTDNQHIRPSSISIIDIDMDGKDEIIFAQGSPQRSVSINSFVDTGVLESILKLEVSNNLNVGYAPIYVTKVDHNKDLALDVLALSPEEINIKVQLFINRDGLISIGPSLLLPYPSGISTPIGLISSGVGNADIDKDGAEEVLLPFESGVVLKLKQEGSDYFLSLLDSPQASLFQFSTPLTELDINDILLGRAEIGITNSSIQQMDLSSFPVAADKSEPLLLSPAPDPALLAPQSDVGGFESPSPSTIETVRLSALPVTSSQSRLSSELSSNTSGFTGQLQQVELSSINNDVNNKTSPTTPTVTLPAGRMKQISLATLGNAPSLPATISDTAYVGQTFLFPVVPTSGTMVSFRKIVLPSGASFNASSKNIRWTPAISQIGLQKFEFQITVQGGSNRQLVEEVKGQGVTVRSRTQVESVQFTVVVLE